LKRTDPTHVGDSPGRVLSRRRLLSLSGAALVAVAGSTRAVWAGIAGVVYGTSIPTLTGFGFEQIAIRQTEVVARASINRMPVIGDFLTEETDPLYAPGPPV
jgi:hypothetical protein